VVSQLAFLFCVLRYRFRYSMKETVAKQGAAPKLVAVFVFCYRGFIWRNRNI